MEKKIDRIGYVGNPNRYDYDEYVALARSRGKIAYNLMIASDEHLCADIIKCEKIHVIGEKWEMPSKAKNIIAYANIIGIPILCLNDITESDIREFTIEFCFDMAFSLIDINNKIASLPDEELHEEN